MNHVKRKQMMLVLPLLVIPFLTMAFWALGGGSGKPAMQTISPGLNTGLPSAQLKEDKLLDKLGFYEKADRDSLKMQEWMRSDPYYKKDTALVFPGELEELASAVPGTYKQRLNTSLGDKRGDKPEDQVIAKLKLLQEEMQKPPAGNAVTLARDEQFSSALDRLEGMMNMNGAGGEDHEMKQLQGTLDKILDIQHPDRVKEGPVRKQGTVYAIGKNKAGDTLVSGFYSYSDEKEFETDQQTGIEAAIASDQTVVNGAVVKFRLLDDVYINGQRVRAHTIVSGIAAVEGERLQIVINSLRCGKSIYAVKLEVYDMDGLPGLYIPGAINRDVAKESLGNSLSLADMAAMDPSFRAQVTATGIGAVKSLVSKRAKLVRVQVKAGYQVFFKNKNNDL